MPESRSESRLDPRNGPSSPLRKLLEQLDETLLRQFFSENALARGRHYIAQVRDLEVAGDTLRAQVLGSERQLYSVSVRLARREFFGEASLEVHTRCSCPVGNRCKHAVGVLLAARRDGALTEKPRAEVLKWVQQLRQRVEQGGRAATTKSKTVREAIAFLLMPRRERAGAELRVLKARRNAAGELGGHAEPWFNFEQALVKPPSFVSDEDLAVFRAMRALQRKRGVGSFSPLELVGVEGAALLRAALRTGRLFLAGDHEDELARPLSEGGQRAGHLVWQMRAEGVLPRLSTDPAADLVLATEPPCYVDSAAGHCGEVLVQDQAAVQAVLELPALSEAELALVDAALHQVAPALPLPGEARSQPLPRLTQALRPVLRLDSLPAWHVRPHRRYEKALGQSLYDYALAAFRYGPASIPAGSDGDLVSLPDGSAAQVQRDAQAEARAMDALHAVGFEAVKPGWLQLFNGSLPVGMLGLESEQAWARFFSSTAPQLREAGWDIDCAADFRHRVLGVDDWQVEVQEGEEGWLSVAMGIVVEGRRLDLAPLLHALFRRDGRWLERDRLARIRDEDPVELYTPEGERIVVRAERIKPLAATLVDLFDTPAGGALQLPPLDAPRLAEALGDGWNTGGRATLQRWVERLSAAGRMQCVEVPQDFGIALRPYQIEGLAWLQHLRAHALGGILADDMGLGKTAQTLAHLLTEKQAGRLDRPALVVLPTSLVFNWQREAQRYAPQLAVLKLHGKARSGLFERIAQADVCLTTYPLLWRDREKLAEHEYHYVILDEAQTVKNASSQAAQVVRQLRTRHRLCLSGTPLENHLGELWAQFDFLMPGLLGDARRFSATWRTPIEKQGNDTRRALLARRIAPFILRRRKDEVAKELPPKTVVVRTVELEGRQRDLYEAVRIAMDQKVREEIAAKGLARSQILILDALLKLRQVCCDPRLVKTDTAARVKERAKLDLLMGMLPELVESGRKVLVFSQFTAMIELIAQALEAEGIAYSVLTGQTQQREAAVRRFQEGAAPVFLISLKAGGVGLNLTAADTVIHYDPWWNPAAEEQATDRAHRLGQDKPVFVYKLVVAGSIEERILALQEKKSALAAGILSDDASALEKFSPDALLSLLEALPE